MNGSPEMMELFRSDSDPQNPQNHRVVTAMC